MGLGDMRWYIYLRVLIITGGNMIMRNLKASVSVTVLACLILPTTVSAAKDNNYFTFGLEAFYDQYHEPSLGVDEHAVYGSVTGTYEHDFGTLFGAVDGRFSYGKDRYSSPDGSDSGIPQMEMDGRIRTGSNISVGNDDVLSPYIGLGVRYFVDEAKNTITSNGFVGYDRRITQFYLPVGAQYTCNMSNGWAMKPLLEYDQLIYGNVDTRLQSLGGPDIENSQTSGYGIRGELMFGKQPNRFTPGWEFGPFVRYWDISQSSIKYFNGGGFAYEPANNRFQIGVALRALF